MEDGMTSLGTVKIRAASGWSSPRLSVAYDLVEEVLDGLGRAESEDAENAAAELRHAMQMIEGADEAMKRVGS